jgi:hypothetical protein
VIGAVAREPHLQHVQRQPAQVKVRVFFESFQQLFVQIGLQQIIFD